MTGFALGRAGVLAMATAVLAGMSACIPDLLQDRDDAILGFENPNACADCHENHFNEWRISNHAYAIADPVFTAMVTLGQQQSQGKLDQFCVQCHTPTGMATGQTQVVFNEDTQFFEQPLDQLDAIARQGVSCDVCHSITDVVEPRNARAVLTPDGVRRATIRDPVETDAHESAYSELHATSNLCSMCHAVVNPRGALVEETFGEWESSSFAREGGKTCQGCHMPTYRGVAAPDAPERELHRHYFVGVDVSLLPESEFPGYYEMREMTAQMLRDAVSFGASMDADNRRLNLSIQNLAGHALPSGATAERQMWVEVIIRDGQNDILFESGTTDANGDLRDGLVGHSLQPRTDPQLVYFGQQMLGIPGLADLSEDQKAVRRQEVEAGCLSMGQGAIDPLTGASAVSFPWQADWQCNYMIPVDQTAYPSYDLSALGSGDYTAEIRLLFRSFPPYFLRKLEEQADLDPAVKTRVPTVVMAEQFLSFRL